MNVDKVWLKQYQEGVPAEINPDQYQSLVHMLEEICTEYSTRIAFNNLGFDLTYQELHLRSNQLARYLQTLQLQKGARIAIMMPNLLQYPVAILGILRAGYVVVNTNPLYTVDEVVHQLNDSGAEVAIVLANFANTIEKALPKMPALKHIIVTEVGDELPWIKRIIVNGVVKHLKKMIPAYNLPHAIAYPTIFSKELNQPLDFSSFSLDDLAFLQYTGGTTGVAKGAMLTNRNMVANILQAYSWITPLHLDKQDIVVTALPLYHIFSLTANCFTFMKSGAKNLLITNPRDLPKFIKIIKNSQFSAFTGVNTLFNALLNHPDFKAVDFSHVKIALSGGMALQKKVALKWQEITHSPILEAYGLTETSPAATINPMYITEYNGSIGLPLSSTEVSIRDSDNNEVDFDVAGELCIRGPQVMAGYWNRPKDTAETFTEDGFLKTGDIAKIDREGFIYIVDRKKDMILVSGFNVYPNEIEQVISSMPGVLEVGVIGVEDENSGERVKACIVKRDPTLTEEAIIAFCREHLTAYKVPKLIQFYAELPKTNVGKILRRSLR